jgi:hypothetical protein
MNDAQWRALIEQADLNPSASGTSSRDLAGRVRLIHRRRMRRHLSLAAAVILGLGGLSWYGLATRRQADVAPSISASPPLASVESIRLDDHLKEAIRLIDREESIIQRLLAAERVGRLANKTSATAISLDARLSREEQVGQAAMTVLLTADRRAKLPHDVRAAREDYVCVMQVFPNTIWAETAERRLVALRP